MVLANVEPESEAEFNRWYDREHMRERVEVPGFLSAQRYLSAGPSPWKYLATYETESLQTLRSPAYTNALARQSSWSKRTLGKFKDPQRCVGERIARQGFGTGGVLSLTLLRPKPGVSDAVRVTLCTKLLPCLRERDGVLAAGLVELDPALSKPIPEYPKSSLGLIEPDGWLVAVDGVGLEQTLFEIAEFLGTDSLDKAQRIGVFRLLWDLHLTDLESASP